MHGRPPVSCDATAGKDRRWTLPSAPRAAAAAEGLLAGLAEQGVVAVATTFVDNAGIARVKAVPLNRFPQLAAWGVGFSPAFDYFRFDDWVAAARVG